MTDITELAQSLKRRAASANEFGESLYVKADDVLALVEALEKAQTKAIEQGRTACELFDEVTALRQRIAELESRSVTVKLTDINEYLAEVHDKTLNRAFRLLAEGVRAGDVAAMRAAGIKVEAE
ncbi:hypothetical protein VSR89_16040 [Klebsiella pneumoniae]|uniref:hypothetical protein n=1 Tax=Klebsiella pneumoniae TaxID=573 RepID=UPI002DBE5E3C|nr:hypothetical protein [Klebsiella pneumoniae]MEC4509569.1 hypothetical protein [Klebsiella pneumoniae]HDO6739746.1 hypothetical protein [Klebsiella pneumoniae]